MEASFSMYSLLKDSFTNSKQEQRAAARFCDKTGSFIFHYTRITIVMKSVSDKFAG